MELLKLFEQDIRQLAYSIRLPREDSIQMLTTELIALVREGPEFEYE